MESQQRRALLLLIAMGGSTVLASYVLAFVLEPDVRTGLWGGIPEGGMRDFYTVNMLLAAVSFFPMTWALGFATPTDALKEKTGIGFVGMLAAYAAILMASALWLPLTALYLGEQSAILWWLIRLILFIVGLGASVLFYMLLQRAKDGSVGIRLAAGLFFFFWLQTAILDALVWPYFFNA
ncbi:MAG: hypothetical protein AB8G23_12095 [Myxococcota bacterium]